MIVLTITIAVLLLVFVQYLRDRNDAVYVRRRLALAQIKARSLREVDAGRYDHWHGYYEQYNQVSYERMMWAFWKPVTAWDKQLGIDERTP